MGIGVGIVLIVIGAILLFALNIDLPFVSDDTLGIILIVAGALALIMALVLQAQRSRTRHVEEKRYDESAARPPQAAACGGRAANDDAASAGVLASTSHVAWDVDADQAACQVSARHC